MTTEPGQYHGMTMAEYLTMNCVSQGTLKLMLDECPRMAWFDSHLNPHRVVEHAEKMDNGTVAHKVLLEGNADNICVIDPKDHPAQSTGAIPDGWTNKSIKTARDNARSWGKTPILLDKMDEIAAMVAAAMEFIDECKPLEPAVWEMFQSNGGHSEVTYVWEDQGVLCRCRTDRIAIDHRLVNDYKTGEISSAPETWGRAKYIKESMYFGAAFYRRGVKAITGIEPEYFYLAQNCNPPYLCSLIGVDAKGFAIGDAMVSAALRDWRACVDANKWPGYPARACYPEIPAYIDAQWLEREVAEVWK